MSNIIYVILFLLFLSDSAFGRGWFPIGDFLPRLALFGLLFLCNNKAIFNRRVLLVLVYYLYIIFMDFSALNETDLVGLFVTFFEIVLPLAILELLINHGCTKDLNMINNYSVLISLATMIGTLTMLSYNPSIARLMASSTNFEGGLSEMRNFQKMGVAGYDFSAIVMFFPVLIVAYYKAFNLKKIYAIVALFLCYLFLFKVQSSTPMILSIVITAVAFFINENTKGYFIIQAAALILIMGFFFPVFLDIVVPYVGGTAFENKVIGLAEFSETGQTSGEVLGRYELYQISMDSFRENVLFGRSDAYIGGHSFILDRLACYGLIGVFLFIYSSYFTIKRAYIWISYPYRWYYLLCVIALLAFALIKNMAGMDYWLYILVYIPCLFKAFEIKQINSLNTK